MVHEKVKAYISDTIFYSDKFDALSDEMKAKAVKHAENFLYLMYKAYNPDKKPLPIEAIAYQTLWVIDKDSSIRQAELGVASTSIEGMTITFKNQDRTVAPEVKNILKKRVGSYSISVPDTNRWVNYR